MNKKITILSLGLLLSSSIVMATPFSDDSVVITESSSGNGLETATLDAKENNNKTASSSSEIKESDETKKESTESSTTQYTVVAGDYLSAIAAKLLGDSNRWPEIVELNKDKYPSLVSNPNLIYVGWTLTIPAKDKKANNSNGSDSNKSSGNSVVASNDNSNSDSKSGKDKSNSNGSSNNSNGNTTNNTGKELITSDSRVLHIGDSHSCGVYGKTIDNLMRETGAKVSTTAVAGSNPNWFMNGQVGTYGAYSKDENGKVTEHAYKQQAKTPLLQNMIDSYKPSVLVVSLGANMVGYPASTQRTMIENICDKAKAAGCKIVWVGPPDSRSQDDNQVANLYSVLKSEIAKYDGVLIDSRQYTEYPSSGGDGLHYSGTEGTAKAKTWANSVMNAIQGK